MVVSDQELAIVILLLCPAFGPSTTRVPEKPLNKNTKVFKLLKDEGMKIYKLSISGNNNMDLRDRFFKTPIIVRLWEKYAPIMTLKDFFAKTEPKKELSQTFSEITGVMRKRYGLLMSSEWVAEYPE